MADGTQYLIELSAKFSGGDAAVSTLSDLGDRMLKAGAASEDMDKAAKAVAVSMDDSATAVKSASAALAEQEQKYRAAEVAADRAAKAVERIGLQAEAQTGKLEKAIAAGDVKKVAALEEKIWALAVRQQAAAETAGTLATAMTAEASALDAVKVKADAASAAHETLRKGAIDLKFAAEEAAKAEAAAAEKTKLAKLAAAEAQKKADAAAAESAKKAKEAAIEKAKAEKTAAAEHAKAAAEQAKIDAKAKGTGKLSDIAQAFGKLGGQAGGAGQSVLGLAGSFGKLGSAMGSAGPYVAIGLAIVAIATAAIAATVAIADWGVKLADANRTQGLLLDGIARSSEGGGKLADTIDDLTTEVPATRAELMQMASTLADTGLRGDELSEALETAAIKAARLKFGPDFKEEMVSLSFQAKRLDENLAATFGGLKIDGLLRGLQTLGALFDASTESGKALKFLFESMFQPLINGTTEVIPKIERLFLYAVILALEAYIALKPYFGLLEGIGKTLAIGAAVLVGVFAVALFLVIGAFGVLYVMLLDVMSTLYELADAFIAVESVIVGALGDALSYVWDLGGNIVNSLIAGMKAKYTALVEATVGLVKGPIAAVEKFLKIGSPSKLMMDIGTNTAEGFAGGVEDGAGGAQSAMEAMVAPPGATASAIGGGAGGAAIVIQQMIVSGENAKELAQDFIEQITRLLEGDARTLGGGEVAHA